MIISFFYHLYGPVCIFTHHPTHVTYAVFDDVRMDVLNDFRFCLLGGNLAIPAFFLQRLVLDSSYLGYIPLCLIYPHIVTTYPAIKEWSMVNCSDASDQEVLWLRCEAGDRGT